MPKGQKGYKTTVQVKLTLPAELAARLNLVLYDQATGTRRYGALSGLITALLVDWLNTKEKPQ